MLSEQELVAWAEEDAAEGPPCPFELPDPSDSSPSAAVPTEQEIRHAASSLLAGRDLNALSIRQFRGELHAHFGSPGSFEARGAEIVSIITEVVQAHSRKISTPDGEDIGTENSTATRRAYLVTASHPATDTTTDGIELKAPRCWTREQICKLLLAALAALQGGRYSPLVFLSMVVFLEHHRSGEVHYHVALLADRCFRFLPFKRFLLTNHGLATHWSCSHDSYATCVAYGYVPSPKKVQTELDPSPYTWAHSGSHPPLSEASRIPTTTLALAKRLEASRLKQAELGKAEKRFRDVDLWPIVIKENILAESSTCAEQVMAYAKRCGGPGMVDYVFQNWSRIKELVARSWAAEKVENHVALHAKSRTQLLEAAAAQDCNCQGRWRNSAMELFAANAIAPEEWCQAMMTAMKQGRSKGNLVCHAGREGNEGKSFLFQPLAGVFGADKVFGTPPKSAFPLLDLENARVVLLDDWRFNESIISYNLQLLWFEGKPIVISRPQNMHAGHLRYTKDDPVFITTLETDIHALKGKLQQGDIDMMLKRLRVFRFHRKLERPDATIPPCSCCFSKLVLTSGQAYPTRPDGSLKRPVHGSTGATPEAKRVACVHWTVEEVVAFVECLGLSHVSHAFRFNAIDGLFLSQLSQEELVGELGLTSLQAKKVLLRLT